MDNDYQIVNPDCDYITDHSFYWLPDILPYLNFFDDSKRYHINDSLKHFFYKAGIDQSDKLFIFSAYSYLEGYTKNGLFLNNNLIKLGIIPYLQAMPEYDLDFSNKIYVFNCLMNRQRHPRVIASWWLANHKLDSCKFVSTQSWQLDDNIRDYLTSMNEELNIGEPKCLPENLLEVSGHDPRKYVTSELGGKIFNEGLRHRAYSPSVFSLVFETVFCELGCSLDEKFISAIYGGTIPIVYGYKVYEEIERWGFDTFSDIIDTSSQYIEDYALRVKTMLERNSHLLEDDVAFEIINDRSVQARLKFNLALARNKSAMIKKMIDRCNPDILERFHSLSINVLDLDGIMSS